MAFSSSDGTLREVQEGGETFSSKDDQDTICCMVLMRNNHTLFPGMSSGSIRAYKWPPSQFNGKYSEQMVHDSPVTQIRMSTGGDLLFSASSTGHVFVHHTVLIDKKTGKVTDSSNVPIREWNAENRHVIVLQKDWEAKAAEMKELATELDDSKANFSFVMHSKDNEWVETVRSTRAESATAIMRERERYEELNNRHELYVHKHIEIVQKLEGERDRLTQELENSYEEKLRVAYKRLDHQSEQLETVRQKAEQVLLKQEASHLEELDAVAFANAKQLRDLKKVAEEFKKELQLERAKSREINKQQETEYELEIQILEKSKEKPVEEERRVSALKQGLLAQERNKYDRLRSKMGLSEAKKLEDLHKIKALEDKIENLESTLCGYKKQLEERERSFHEKEKTILHLRSNNRTLDNFRFVLDARISKLQEEKGPVEEHVKQLETHIRDMYNELVEEFTEKKATELQVNNKDMKLDALGKEVIKLRTACREKDREVSNLSHAISTSSTMADAYEVQQYIKDVHHIQVLKDSKYKKRVNDDSPTVSNTDGNGDAIAAMEESTRQRNFMLQTVNAQKKALKSSNQKWPTSHRRTFKKMPS